MESHFFIALPGIIIMKLYPRCTYCHQLLANSRYIINQKHKPTRNNIRILCTRKLIHKILSSLVRIFSIIIWRKGEMIPKKESKRARFMFVSSIQLIKSYFGVRCFRTKKSKGEEKMIEITKLMIIESRSRCTRVIKKTQAVSIRPRYSTVNIAKFHFSTRENRENSRCVTPVIQR